MAKKISDAERERVFEQLKDFQQRFGHGYMKALIKASGINRTSLSAFRNNNGSGGDNVVRKIRETLDKLNESSVSNEIPGEIQ